jgi:hypothetical protein
MAKQQLAKTNGSAIAEAAPPSSPVAALPSAFWELPEDLQGQVVGGVLSEDLHAAVVNALLIDSGLEATALAMMMIERYAHLYIFTRVRETKGIGGPEDPTEGPTEGFKDERAYKETLQQLNNQAVTLQKVNYSVDETAIKENVLDKVDSHIETAIATLPTEWQTKVRSALDLELKQGTY